MKDKKLVTKSNQINEARYKLSALEQKMILSVVAEIQPEDKEFKTYRLKITDFIKLLGLSGKTIYSDIQKITVELMKKVLVIPKSQPNPEDDSILIAHWFSSVEYFPGKGYVDFCFDPKLKSYLLQLKERFVSYQLKNIVQLKSSYSIRIYELLKQYEKIGCRQFELHELRRILGIKKNEYKLYGHFKTRVLIPSQNEIPLKTDLNFSFEEIKEGREVAYIKFYIHKDLRKKKETTLKNNNQYNSPLHKESQLNDLINILPEHEREKKTIINILTKYMTQQDFDYVSRNIKYTNKHCNSNYRLFLSKALKEDWGLELKEDEEAKEKITSAQKERRKSEEEKRAKEEAIKKQIEDYIEIHKEKLREEAVERLDEELRHGLEQDDPISRFALTGLIQQIASEKLALQP